MPPAKNSKVETSKTVLTTVRVPKSIDAIVDTLVEAKVFKTKTEIINTALERFLTEVYIALVTINNMPIADYLSDPQKMKDMFKDPEFIKGVDLAQGLSTKLFIYYVLDLPRKIPDKKFPQIISKMNDQFGEILGQLYAEILEMSQKKEDKGTSNDVVAHAPPTGNHSEQQHFGGDPHEGV